MKKQLVSILLAGIFVSSLLGAIAYAYWDSTNRLAEMESEYKQLLSDYTTLNSDYAHLVGEHKTLNETYLALNHTYHNLLATYADLNSQFFNLNNSYVTLSSSYASLDQKYAKLETQFDTLNQSYSTLSGNYDALNQSYTTLQEQYSQFNTLYTQLQANYIALNTTYNILYEENKALEKMWNQPLDYVLTPTRDEVKQWLTIDETNELAYDTEKFLCGDFSIMLIQHAKAKQWRMLFTVIEFDYYSENPLGIKQHHGNHAHAFVSVFTTEGIIYIEPQTDFDWYLYIEGEPDTHVEFTDWEFIDFGSEWFGHIFVQYYNRMGTYVDPNPTTTGQIKVSNSLGQ